MRHVLLRFQIPRCMQNAFVLLSRRAFSTAITKKMTVETATFAAGCFWGVEKVFKKHFPGIQTKVGYIGGTKENPTYREVCGKDTGHAEAIEIQYDPSAYNYEGLVDLFYRMHDPTTLNRQGGDVGSQYRSAIFYHNEEQHKIAHDVTERVRSKFGRRGVSTTFEKAGTFWDAEDYHQDYLEKNPHGYECPTHFVRNWDQIESLYSNA
ncbi:peptide methionine sulfoxide reductase [Cladochytrium replicatum]|nr:peptide methionine sulfoxide reductase [Cladochytrium replicatum]